MALQYRNAVIGELSRIVEIYNSTIPGRMVTADTDPVTVESRVAWFNAHDPGHRPLWMVMNESDNIGWVSFQWFYGRPAYNGTAEISIYLDERARGKGYGRQILQHAMNSCERLKIKTLLGYIFAHNVPSLKLFRNAGFDNWGHFPRVAVLDEVERDLIIVGKRING
ncbi:MAG: N-acetyltransferase [Chitinophagaceae bacterium]|nr:N-acetyltransferase [Chitinophagaceae bacterium]